MILSGDGGDELFLGYGAYHWANRFSNPLIYYNRKIISSLFMLFGTNRLKRVARLLDYKAGTNIHSHIFSQEQYYFSVSELNELLINVSTSFNTSLQSPTTNQRKLSLQEKQSLFDIQYYLKDDLLVKVDRASMKCSIEAREPLLDYRLVEFALNLNENLKNNQIGQKYILKEVLYTYLPPELFQRPKWGFSIPLSEWIRKDLRFLIEDYLSEKAINETGIFRNKIIKNLLKRFNKGENYLYNRIWLMIVLQHFFIKNKSSL
jgi:asparagine synthase (glutamine-hydrolysing)